jgi:hypothetical protein
MLRLVSLAACVLSFASFAQIEAVFPELKETNKYCEEIFAKQDNSGEVKTSPLFKEGEKPLYELGFCLALSRILEITSPPDEKETKADAFLKQIAFRNEAELVWNEAIELSGKIQKAQGSQGKKAHTARLKALLGTAKRMYLGKEENENGNFPATISRFLPPHASLVRLQNALFENR